MRELNNQMTIASDATRLHELCSNVDTFMNSAFDLMLLSDMNIPDEEFVT